MCTVGEIKKLSCYLDSDFCGLIGSEDPKDPMSVKPGTGNLIKLGTVQIYWVSKLKKRIAHSTMAADYISLSQAMIDLFPV